MQRNYYYQEYKDLAGENSYQGITWPKGSADFWENAVEEITQKLRKEFREQEEQRKLLEEAERKKKLPNSEKAFRGDKLYPIDENTTVRDITFKLLPTPLKTSLKKLPQGKKILDIQDMKISGDKKLSDYIVSPKDKIRLTIAPVIYLDYVNSKNPNFSITDNYRDKSKRIRRTPAPFNYFGNSYGPIERYLEEYLSEYYNSLDFIIDWDKTKITHINGKPTTFNSEFSQTSPEQRRAEFLRMKSPYPLKIINDCIYDFKKDNNYKKQHDNCVIDYILHRYKRIAKKNVLKYLTLDGDYILLKTLFNFCKKYNIKTTAYDIRGKVIKSLIPEKDTKNHAVLNILVYDSHLYPLHGRYVKQVKSDAVFEKIIEVEPIEDKSPLLDKLAKILTLDRELPGDIYTKNKQLIHFSYNHNLYVCNPDYFICQKISDALQIGQTPFHITIQTYGMWLARNYNCNYNSLWASAGEYQKTAYNYVSPNAYDYMGKKITTVDKKKCYSAALHALPFIPVINTFTDDYLELDTTLAQIEEIEPHYLYTIEIKKSSVIFPDNNIYFGFLLKHAKEMLKHSNCDWLDVKITGVQKATKKENRYKQLIEDLYAAKDENGELFKEIKYIVNSLWGNMLRIKGASHITVFDSIADSDSLEKHILQEDPFIDQFPIENTGYTMLYKNIELPKKVDTLRPAGYAVMDASRLFLIEKLGELDPNSILGVKTDSITFLSDENPDFTIKNYDCPFIGWKYERHQEVLTEGIFKNIVSVKESCEYRELPKPKYSFPSPTKEKHKIITGNAGNGKTYHICNTLIPTLLKENTHIIIMCNSHLSLKIYRDLFEGNPRINIMTIAKISTMISKNPQNVFNLSPEFNENGNVFSQKHLIIDEVGLVNSEDFSIIYQMAPYYSIHMYGDFTQLPPVGGRQISLVNLDRYFNVKTKKGNYRNNFSEEYYDHLRYSEYDNLKEVMRFSKNAPISELDFTKGTFISYTRDTTDKYNEIIINELFGDDPYKNDSLLLRCIINCKTLKDKKVYNCSVFTKKELLEKGVKESTLRNPEYFSPAYCVNIHRLQGQTIDWYSFCEEDSAFLDNTTTYTIISRLRQS